MLRRACLDLLKTRPLHPCASVLTPGIFGGGNRTLSSASASSSSSGKDEDEKENAEGWGDLPKSEEELANRRAKALRKWLENEVGEERASLMTILGTHKVKVPGGGEEAKAFMDDLLLWTAKGQLLAKEEEEKKKSFEEEFGLPFDE